MTANVKLLPCPFCGGEAELRSDFADNDPSEHTCCTALVRCMECLAETDIADSCLADFNTEAHAIAAWNKRSPSPTPKAGETPTPDSLRKLAAWFDDPKNPAVSVALREGVFTPGQLLRHEIERFDTIILDANKIEHERLALVKELEEAKAELENEKARDIHSCGPCCTKPGCVNRRLAADLAAARERCASLDEELEIIRRNIAGGAVSVHWVQKYIEDRRAERLKDHPQPPTANVTEG